jgi:folylpolyglutamate synthase/dihydropteroate synthase
MTSLLFPLAGRIILTAPDNSRALPPEQIPADDPIITHSVAEALQSLRRAAPDDVVFITGSLFVVGEARHLLVQ